MILGAVTAMFVQFYGDVLPLSVQTCVTQRLINLNDELARCSNKSMFCYSLAILTVIVIDIASTTGDNAVT